MRPARAVAEAIEPATLKAIAERVDVVVAAVDERDLDVDQREAGEDAALARPRGRPSRRPG